MKRFMIILITLLLAVTTAACAAGSDAKNDSTPGSQVSEGSDNGAANQKQDTDALEETAEEELEITHQLGVTTVKKNPQTVVVFDFGSLDTLDKLGVEVKGVPQASVPGYLSKYAEEPYVNVGSLKEPDMETIYGLQPDLIIISGRQSDYYKELSEIAPTIFMGVDTERYMASFRENVMTLAGIFGKEEEAEAELAAIEERVAAVSEKMSASEETGLIILTTGGKVSAFGPGSRFGIIHDELGVKPADPSIDVDTHGMSISFEFIAEKDPDYLFVVDRDAVVGDAAATPAAAVLDNELIHKTKAYQNDNIVYLSPDYWYLSGGGLISTAEMVKEVEEGLQ